MELTERQIKIIDGRICPYCGGTPEYVDSSVIYGKSYGMIYLCRKCDAYVGVHKGLRKALGRLANRELRYWKKQAHEYFDQVWKTKQMTRSESYAWLSKQLGLPDHLTHIGMFDCKTCKEVVEVSKQLLNDLRRLDMDFGAEPKTDYLT